MPENNDEGKIPDFSLAKRQRVAEELFPRSVAELTERIEYIRTMVIKWQALLSSLDQGLKARDPVSEDGISIDEAAQEDFSISDRAQAMESCDSTEVEVNHPTDATLRDLLAPVSDKEVAGFYDFFKAIQGRSTELFNLLSFHHQDLVEKQKARMMRHMEQVHPFFHGDLLPLMQLYGISLRVNPSGKLYHPLIDPRDVSDYSPVPIDLAFENKLSQSVGGIESASNALEENNRIWTHNIFLKRSDEQSDKSLKNEGEVIIVNIRINKGQIHEMKARYASYRPLPFDLKALRDRHDETQPGNLSVPVYRGNGSDKPGKPWWRFWKKS